MEPLYNPKQTIKIEATDWSLGVAQLARYKAGERSARMRSHMAAVIVLSAQTEFLVARQSLYQSGKVPADAQTEQWVWDSICSADTCAFGANIDTADSVGLGPLYRSTEQVIRNLLNGSRRVETVGRGDVVLPPGGVEDLGALPVVAYFALALTGAAAAAAVAWWGASKSEDSAEVEMHSAEMATMLAQRQMWLDDNLARGGPPPEPPPYFKALSKQAEQGGFWAIGAGVVLGGLAVVGIQEASKAPAVRRMNPAPTAKPRPRLQSSATTTPKRKPAKKKTAKRKTTAKKKTAKRKVTKRKTNPKRKTAKKTAKRKTAKKKTAKKKTAKRKTAKKKRPAKKTKRRRAA